MTLVYNNASVSKMNTSIKKQFRFIDTVKKEKNTIVITGLVGSKYQTAFINDTFIEDCKPVTDLIKKNESMVYKVNNKNMSPYELMTLFQKSAPSNIQRYKGLGEMDGKRLFDSTLNPENRTLIQYTIESVKEEIETIRYYESNRSELIQDAKLSRFEVIE